MAKLYFTLDTPKADECLELVGRVQDSIDIVEVGNPILIEAGLPLVRMIKEAYPRLTVVADAKIYHGGRYIADRCFDMGADIVTVLASSSDESISGAVYGGMSRGKYVMADLAGVSRPSVRAQELEELGVKYMCIPSGLPNEEGLDIMNRGDQSGSKKVRRPIFGAPLSRARDVKRSLRHAELAVAGNIDENNISRVLGAGADIVMVGRAIVNAQDPGEAARELKAKMGA